VLTQRYCAQGHIALDEATFPEGTPGFVLDALARMPLWKYGLDYMHGTGHGVGAALNVHEGPQGISFRYGNQQPLMVDMIVSNEPGYYEDGKFGVRIENLACIVEAPTEFRFAGKTYMTLEAITMVPIETKLIDKSIMTAGEVAWMNSYHELVRKKVAPRLVEAGKERALAWLERKTQPI
jgi:Xaa-Pro aminopeptidase